MSLARLVSAGLLVAGGLILGAFTLHGYFDPQWMQTQAQSSGARAGPLDAKANGTFHARSRFVSSRGEPANSSARPPASMLAVSGPSGVVKAVDAKPAAKPPAKKKVAEKPKKAPPPQQQASVWPWSLFGN